MAVLFLVFKDQKTGSSSGCRQVGFPHRIGVRQQMDRDGDKEGAPFAGFTFNVQFAFHQFNQSPGDGQSQSRPSVRTGDRSIALFIRFKERIEPSGINADTGILH